MNDTRTPGGNLFAEVLKPAPPAVFDERLIIDFVRWIDRTDRTTRAYLTNLRQFIAWLKFAGISDPARPDIIAYKEWLSREHYGIALAPAATAGWIYRTDRTGDRVIVRCKPGTIAQYLRSVSQFFRWTAANSLYPDIAANVHPPKIRHDIHHRDALTPEEVLTIEQSIDRRALDSVQQAQEAMKDQRGRVQRLTEQGARLRALYLLAVNAGLRTVELSRANVQDFETVHGQDRLRIWGKGHSEADQIKPLAPPVADAIRDYLRTRTDAPTGSSPLFIGTGNRSGGRRLTPATIGTLLTKAMREAGYNSSRLTAHSLRHTAGTAVQELTGDLFKTQRYMRHADPKTTEIYLHNDTEQAEAGIAQQLYALYHSTSADDPRQRLADLLTRLTPEQVQQLAGLAESMT